MALNDWVGWIIALATFVIGIPVAFWVGKRNRQVPDLRRATGFQRLGSLDRTFGPGVSASYGGVPLKAVSRSHLALWNHRGDHVDGSAILRDDPLRIEVDNDDVVLQTRLISQSRAQIGLRTEKTGSETLVKFNFLDAGDGGILEVLHKGRNPARIVGTIPGAKLGPVVNAQLGPGARKAVRSSRWQRTITMMRGRSRRLFAWAGMIGSGLGMALGSLIALISYVRTPKLVDSSKYGLDTLDGQLAFAKAVRENGTFDWTTIAMLLAVLLFALIIIFIYVRRIIRMTTAVVPRSIVADDFDPADRAATADRRAYRLVPIAGEAEQSPSSTTAAAIPPMLD